MTPSQPPAGGAEGAPEVDPDAVARAARAVPGVVDLNAGAFSEIATYLPGRTVFGVRANRKDRVEVSVVAAYDQDLQVLGRRVRNSLLPLVGDREVVVGIGDVALPPELQENGGESPGGPRSSAGAGI